MTAEDADAAALRRYEGIYRDLYATSSRAFYLCVALTVLWGLAIFFWVIPVIVPGLAAELSGIAGFVALTLIVFVPFFAFGPLTSLTIDRRHRRAFEALNAAQMFDGTRSGRRARAHTRSRAAALTAGAAADTLPPSHRIRLLTWAGDYDEARRQLEVFPRASALDEFEHALLFAVVDFVETGEASLEDASSRLREVPVGRERDYATTMLAFERARMERETRGDWIEPLSRARDELSDVPFRAAGFGRQVQAWLIGVVVIVIASLVGVLI